MEEEKRQKEKERQKEEKEQQRKQAGRLGDQQCRACEAARLRSLPRLDERQAGGRVGDVHADGVATDLVQLDVARHPQAHDDLVGFEGQIGGAVGG